jgi:hypothetical protein
MWELRERAADFPPQLNEIGGLKFPSAHLMLSPQPYSLPLPSSALALKGTDISQVELPPDSPQFSLQFLTR